MGIFIRRTKEERLGKPRLNENPKEKVQEKAFNGYVRGVDFW